MTHESVVDLPPERQETGRADITITLAPAVPARLPTMTRRREPITIGVPFPRDFCSNPDVLAIFDPAGRQLPVQAKILETWPGGSIRWALIDFQADIAARKTPAFQLRIDSTSGKAPAHGVVVEENEKTISIDTGRARFLIPRQGRFPFEAVTIEGQAAIDPERTALQIESTVGSRDTARITAASVEENGPLRSVILLHGTAGRNGRKPLLEMIARLHFFAGLSTVRFDVTMRNPRKAAHPGGYWQLGDGGSVYLRDLSLELALPSGPEPTEIHCSSEPDAPFEKVQSPLELYQDSSGGENWKSRNHLNRHHLVPTRFCGYRLRTDGVESTGLRAIPIVSLARGARRLAVTLPYFWQNFPKAVEAATDSVALRLFPRQYADVHEIQGGEQKTHTVFASFGRDDVTEVPLAWCRERLLPRLEPSWYCSTGAVPYLIPTADDPNRDYTRLVNAAIEGDDTFERKREVIDEYGWRHFGDIYGDHEAVFRDGAPPLVSHYNNQYDVVAGFAYQFLRTGDPRWWAQMEQLASHVIDIDIYHTDRDKSAYNQGLFWHTYHYIDADRATHRSYPRAPKIGGGGPSAEQNYTTGLMLHYFLTGDPRLREAAIGLARFVVDIDDGRKTVFRWLARGRTGLATASGSFMYHGPGRGGANSLNALIDGHRLTGETALLEKAEELIRRAVHPLEEVETHHLLDAERKWFYTMFLQALGKYLDHKADSRQLDDMYTYGRACLLHYARWMAVHEYPYLDKSEMLEYPTETWAAQDIRKSEVFKFAAKHARGAERSRFLERSEFFFRYSTTTLMTMSTRTLARPVVVLLSNGFMHAYFKLRPETAAALPTRSDIKWPEREVFVPQKVAAKKRFVALLLLCSLLGLASLLAEWINR